MLHRDQLKRALSQTYRYDKGICHDATTIQYDDKIFSDPAVVHLIDPSTTTGMFLNEHVSFAMFFCSPTLQNIQPYHLKNMLTLYMPLWTLEEFGQCCDELEIPHFYKVTFEKWGVYLSPKCPYGNSVVQYIGYCSFKRPVVSEG